MKKEEKEWVRMFLKKNFNYSTKVLGIYLWVATNEGEHSLKISWLGLKEATGLCVPKLRICLKQLKQISFVKMEHKYKTPTMTITLVGGKNE